MKAYEFTAQINSAGQLEIPTDIAEQLPRGQTVQVVVTVGGNADSKKSNGQPKHRLEGVPIKDLWPSGDPISDEDARLMIEAIESECERVDLNEWQ